MYRAPLCCPLTDLIFLINVSKGSYLARRLINDILINFINKNGRDQTQLPTLKTATVFIIM